MLFQYGSYAGRGVFQTLIDWGFLDALLPFILIFTIIFAVLQRVKLFGEGTGDARKGDRRINGIIALVIAAMVVVPHITGLYSPDSDPVNIINTFLPQTAVILVAILCVVLLLGLAGGEIPSVMLWAIALVALGFLVFMILMAILPGWWPTFSFLRDPSVQALIIILLVLGLVGFFIIREPPKPNETPFKSFLKNWMGAP